MKIRDAIGNELRPDDTVVWNIGGSQIKATVIEALRPGLISTRSGQKSEGRVVLRLELGLADPGTSKDIVLASFIKTFDPAGEKIAEAAIVRGQVG